MKDYYLKGMYETCIHAEECSKTTYGMNNDICQGCKTYSPMTITDKPTRPAKGGRKMSANNRHLRRLI